MKKVMYMVLLVTGIITGNPFGAKSQVSVNVNISTQPLWGPAGYDYAEYYYFPDMEMYYYVPAHKFVYINGGRWVFASSVPVYYRNYDLYTVHKVVINSPRPYRHFHSHKVKYAKYRGGPHHQVMIRSSNNPKYYVVKGHPHYGRGHKAGGSFGSKRTYKAPAHHNNSYFGPRSKKDHQPGPSHTRSFKDNGPKHQKHDGGKPGGKGHGGGGGKHGGGKRK